MEHSDLNNGTAEDDNHAVVPCSDLNFESEFDFLKDTTPNIDELLETQQDKQEFVSFIEKFDTAFDFTNCIMSDINVPSTSSKILDYSNSISYNSLASSSFDNQANKEYNSSFSTSKNFQYKGKSTYHNSDHFVGSDRHNNDLQNSFPQATNCDYKMVEQCNVNSLEAYVAEVSKSLTSSTNRAHKADLINLSPETKLKEKIFNVNFEEKYLSHTNGKILAFKSVFQNDVDYEIVEEPGNSTAKCLKCQLTFRSINRFLEHMLDHRMDVRSKCTSCHKVFSKIRYLKRHVSSTCHNNEVSPHICSVCQRMFIYKRSLKRHITKVHRKVREYICSVCKKKYWRKDLLEAHHVLVHMKTTMHVCSFCSKRFSSNRSLKRHTANLHIKQFR